MSVSGPLGGFPQGASAELRTRALSHSRGWRGIQLTHPAWGPVGLAGVLVCALVLALGAAGTDTLLPESVRPVPSWLAGPFGSTGLHLPAGVLITLMLAMFASYVVAVQSIGRLSPRVVLMSIAAVHAVMLLAPPLLSTDVFSYQAYARIWADYGANPYLHGPHTIALDPLYPYIGAKWVGTPSAYGPLFTVMSAWTAGLSIAASALAFKAIAALASLTTVALVWNAARIRGLNSARAAAAVALNPLVVVYGVGGGHNDLLMLTLVMAGVYAALCQRERLAGAMPVLAAGVKLTGGLFLPFALAAPSGPGASSRRREMVIGAAIAAVAVLAFGFGAFGFGQLHVISTLQHTQGEGDWHSIPGFISSVFGLGTAGRIAGILLGIVFLGVFAYLLRRVWHGEMDWIDGAGWAAVALLATAGSMLPWYVVWLMPFAVLSRDRRLWRATIVVSAIVLAIQLISYIPSHGTVPGL